MQNTKKEGGKMNGWVVTFSAIILTTIITTLAVDATDNRGDLSKSILGAVILGTQEEAPCPAGMTQIASPSGNFCIDRYEASPSKECQFDNPRNNDETLLNLESTSCKAESKPDVLPWRNIARHQAELACAQAEKFLPSNEQWYLASLGTPDSEVAVQNGICHTNGNTASLTRTRDKCVSSSGSYDMIGNVWEWVSGTVTEGTYNGRTLPSEGFVTSIDVDGTPLTTQGGSGSKSFNDDYFSIEQTAVRGMFRGGYFGSGSDAGHYAVNVVAPPTFSGEAVGFRCAK